MAVHIPTRVPAHKFDPAENYRVEIEECTAGGETCEQIAAALRLKGVTITNKTISRRRVEWGLRKKPPNKSLGSKVTKPRPKKSSTRTAKSGARKAEIELGTQRGESAEQIANALIAQGCELKKGASTITRLQTQWGLIPYDENRARGRRSTNGTSPRVKKPKVPKVSRRELEREANQQQQTQTMHYPTNCSFGPKKRVNGNVLDADGDPSLDPDSDSELLPNPTSLDTVPGRYEPRQAQSAVDVAAEIMSVDFLVDLANSTLGAAQNLKDMLLAYQARRPVDSLASAPPTIEDLSTARRKVREAAAVMHDLAADPGT